jgi:ankyrin repeat protein
MMRMEAEAAGPQPQEDATLSLHDAMTRATGGAPALSLLEATVCVILRDHPESIQERDADGYLPLHAALLLVTNPLGVVRRLVQADPAALHARTHCGMLPLHVAVVAAPLDTVQFLAQAGPPCLLSERDGHGHTALHGAIQCGRPLEVIRCLVHVGPQALREPAAGDNDDHRFLPLHAAVATEACSPEVVEYLAEAWTGALRVRSGNGGLLPLHLAARRRGCTSLRRVRCLLRLYPQAICERSGDGRLALHEAADHSAAVDVVECLTDAWPQALVENSWEAADGGALPLHLAAGRLYPNAQIVQLLAARHPPALLKADQANGSLPLHRAAAAQSESLEALQVLVAMCPRSVRTKDKRGRLPLHLVVAGRASTSAFTTLAGVRCLAEAYPRGLAEQAVCGQLPLHAAAGRGASLEVVRYLVRQFSRALHEPDAMGFLPVHCAASSGADLKVVRFLVEAYPQGLRAIVHATKVPLRFAPPGEATLRVLNECCEALPIGLHLPSSGGWYSWMKDAVRDMVETVRFLFFGCEPPTLHLPSSDGRLPLHLAAGRASSLEVVRYLADADPRALQQRDGHGCLPLHWAAQRSAMMADAPATTTVKEIVTILSEAHPQGLLEASDRGSVGSLCIMPSPARRPRSRWFATSPKRPRRPC